MNSIRFDTAILLFSRSPNKESSAKPLLASKKATNQRVVRQLISHTKAIAVQSKLPVFIISEQKQVGQSFGARLANAFEQIFKLGYERVISIGNDCPTLRPSDLVTAADQLDNHSMVIGPATDGGAYLIGMRRADFAPIDFQKIQWQTALVFSDLKLYAKGSCFCLEAQSDIDSLADLTRVLHAVKLPKLLKYRLLLCIKVQFLKDFCLVESPPILFYHPHFALRGPPLCSNN